GSMADADPPPTRMLTTSTEALPKMLLLTPIAPNSQVHHLSGRNLLPHARGVATRAPQHDLQGITLALELTIRPLDTAKPSPAPTNTNFRQSPVDCSFAISKAYTATTRHR